MACMDVTRPLPPATAPRLLLVVAAALLDADGRVLLAQRPEGKSLAGLWEFPGGKLQAQETPEAALVRELFEELGVRTSIPCLWPLGFASHTYTEFHLLMPLYRVQQWAGTPVGKEGQNVAWVRAGDLAHYPMPPADYPLLPVLRAALA